MGYEWQLEKKLSSREKILEASSKYLRRSGLLGASVAKIMKAAGLTVGGFYSHFSSKEDLFKHTFKKMIDDVIVYIASIKGASGKIRAQNFFKIYLSPQHRDNLQEGCPIAALATEVAREDLEIRKLFAEELSRLIEQRKEVFADPNAKWSDPRAIAVMSTYVGGLILARATRGTDLSDQILSATQNHIQKQLEEL